MAPATWTRVWSQKTTFLGRPGTSSLSLGQSHPRPPPDPWPLPLALWFLADPPPVPSLSWRGTHVCVRGHCLLPALQPRDLSVAEAGAPPVPSAYVGVGGCGPHRAEEPHRPRRDRQPGDSRVYSLATRAPTKPRQGTSARPVWSARSACRGAHRPHWHLLHSGARP